MSEQSKQPPSATVTQLHPKSPMPGISSELVVLWTQEWMGDPWMRGNTISSDYIAARAYAIGFNEGFAAAGGSGQAVHHAQPTGTMFSAEGGSHLWGEFNPRPGPHSPESGKVLLDIADVRKLLGGFGVSYKEMEAPLMRQLFRDHPDALRRVAEDVGAALPARPAARPLNNLDAWNPLLLDEAKRLRVCRVCRQDDIATPGNPFRYSFGTEYAHQRCLDLMDPFIAVKGDSAPALPLMSGDVSEHPVCVECGDGIMVHDPGICGTCYAVNYAPPDNAEGEAAARDVSVVSVSNGGATNA